MWAKKMPIFLYSRFFNHPTTSAKSESGMEGPSSTRGGPLGPGHLGGHPGAPGTLHGSIDPTGFPMGLISRERGPRSAHHTDLPTSLITNLTHKAQRPHGSSGADTHHKSLANGYPGSRDHSGSRAETNSDR